MRGDEPSVVRQGDVYWYDFGPATGSAPAFRRPCVIVQGDHFNSTALRTTVVCIITSNQLLARAPGNVALPKGAGGLPKPSVVNISQLFTVDKSGLIERIGRLDTASVGAIRAGISLLIE